MHQTHQICEYKSDFAWQIPFEICLRSQFEKFSRHRCQKKVRENELANFQRLKYVKNRLLEADRGTFEVRFGF